MFLILSLLFKNPHQTEENGPMGVVLSYFSLSTASRLPEYDYPP